MRTYLALLTAVVLVFGVVTMATAQTGSAPKLAAPPAIYLPYGAKVVTEINVSDSDVLGIIKEVIPAAADVARDIIPLRSGATGQAGLSGVGMMAAIAGIADTELLLEAIDGVKNIRFIVARYDRPMDLQNFIEEFGSGVAKAGPFSKILSDFGHFPGAVAVYALPDNGGCMGFAYDPSERTVYAARMVGGVDMPKLIKFAGGLAKMAVLSRVEVNQETGEPLVMEAPQVPKPPAQE